MAEIRGSAASCDPPHRAATTAMVALVMGCARLATLVGVAIAYSCNGADALPTTFDYPKAGVAGRRGAARRPSSARNT